MYILFEKSNSEGCNCISGYDAMGFTTSESSAMTWRDENPDYRTYKYCPNKELIND